MTRDWTTYLPTIRAVLAQHTRVIDAMPAIRQALGFPLSERALRDIFARHGLGQLAGHCAQPGVPAVQTSPVAREVADVDQVAALVEAVKRAPRGVVELADELDMSPARVRALAEQARSKGFNVEIAHDAVGRPPRQEAHSATDQGHRVVMQPGEWQMFGYVTDLHFGSKHHLRAELQDHVAYCYAMGARVMICTGDMLDGTYRHSRWEQSEHGFEEQCAAMLEGLPYFPDVQWHAILGNHDQKFEEETGLDVGRAIMDRFQAAGRNDLVIHGARGAYINLRAPGECERGIFVEMWHPLKGCGYALTYQLQNHIRDYAVGQKPDILLTGHWHKQVYFTQRGVHAFAGGCFQGGGSSFGKSLGGAPSIGGWLIRYRTTPDGTIRDIVPQWRAYYERESVREVEMS